MPIFRSVVAKQCDQPGCTRHRQRVDLHAGFCEECEAPLVAVFGANPRNITLAIVGPVVLTLLVFFLANRPRPLTEERRHQLEAWGREADRDGFVTPQEEAVLADLVERERLDSEAVSKLLAEARRLRAESRSAAERGHRLAAQHLYAEAGREYLRAVESDPGNATAWANLGLARAASGNEGEAVESYTRALEIEPGNWLAHYNLGLLWARRGDSEQALRHLEAAFAAVPDSAGPERRSMVADLQTSTPDSLKRNPRFRVLVAGPGGS